MDAAEVRRSVPGVAGVADTADTAAVAPSTADRADRTDRGDRADRADPDAIDFAAVYRAQFRRRPLLPKPASAWDGRARDYASHSGRSGYAQDFLARLDLSGARTLLDVGCGPGTLALPLARRGISVVALDHSAAMLEQLRAKAGEQELTNVQTIHRAWEDDWHNVPVCDLAIASRSTTVDDLDAALAKLQRHARLRATLSYPADGAFIDAGIAAALGIELPRVPDLTLLVGMLRRRGLQPRIDYLQTPSRLAGCEGFDAFAQRLAWSTGPFDDAARERLRRWYEADPARAARGGAGMRWAFVWWAVDGS
ncbi:MAG: class I SAM-dependent methyltransferase [Proteobacteria bacterium]|nr:class I SAM-dependent methyltransferase [Pseudomonadota bacterium]